MNHALIDLNPIELNYYKCAKPYDYYNKSYVQKNIAGILAHVFVRITSIWKILLLI